MGAVASVIAGPVLGAVPTPSASLILALALLAAAAAFTTKLLGTYLGLHIAGPLITLTLWSTVAAADMGPRWNPHRVAASSAAAGGDQRPAGQWAYGTAPLALRRAGVPAGGQG